MDTNKKTFERFSEKMGDPVSLNDTDWKSINKKINKKFFFKWRPASFNIYYLSILILSTTTFSYYFYSKNNQENKVAEDKCISYDNLPLITSLKETGKKFTNTNRQQNIKKSTSSINKELNDLGEKAKRKKIEITEGFNIKNNTSQNTNNNKKQSDNQYNSNNKKQNEVKLSIEENTHPEFNNNLNNKKESEKGLGINDTSFIQNLPSDLKTDVSITNENSFIKNNNLIDSVNFNDHFIDSMGIGKSDTSQALPDSSIHQPVVIHRRDTIFNYDSTKVPRFKKKKFGL